jgi:hypothetical protein
MAAVLVLAGAALAPAHPSAASTALLHGRASAARSAGDGGSGTYTVFGASYDFELRNGGTTQWQSFVLVGPPGTTFLGGATAGEITARCVGGQPDGQVNEIECGPLSVTPGAQVLLVATVAAPGSCAAGFGLTVISAGSTAGTNVGEVTPAGSCAAASPTGVATPRLVTRPKLRGTPVAGGLLGLTPPRWSAPATHVVYQWQLCTGTGCRRIAGAAGPTLRLTAVEIGRSVRVVVSAAVSGAELTAASGRVAVRVRPAPR